jgi:hypothetical protein
MEQQAPMPGMILWRKTGRGFLHRPNRIIKPGDVFWAFPHEISRAFRDTVIPVDPAKLEKLEPTPDKVMADDIPGVPLDFTMKQRSNSEKFDIFDGSGKKINEKGLPQEKAEEYLKSLMS